MGRDRYSTMRVDSYSSFQAPTPQIITLVAKSISIEGQALNQIACVELVLLLKINVGMASGPCIISLVV